MLSWVLLAAALSGPLSVSHRAFVEDEARFLLSASQRERFIALDSEELRQGFIDRFWQVHDQERLASRRRLAARWFGESGVSSAPGRVLQQLGAPRFRTDLSRAGNRLVPVQLWHYTGIDLSFLPDAFYLIFYRAEGVGPYRLWDPDIDGIAALVPSHEPGRLRIEAADPILADIDPKLTLVDVDPELTLAMSELVPGGGPSGARSLLTNLDVFADLMERERDREARVLTSASARSLEASVIATVWPDDVGVLELHYALELPAGETEKLEWASAGARLRVPLRVLGQIFSGDMERDRWEDQLWLEVSAEEKSRLAETAVSLQGRKLISEDDERLELAVLAGNASVFVSAEIEMRAVVALGSRVTAPDETVLPFQLGDRQWLPRAVYEVGSGADETVTVLAPFPEGHQENVGWEVWRDDALVAEDTRPGDGVALLSVPHVRVGETYRVRAVRPTDERTVVFTLSPERNDGKTRVLSRHRTSLELDRYRVARAIAWVDRSRPALGFAELSPDDVGAHVALSRHLYEMRAYGAILEHLGAASLRFADEVDVFVLLGAAASALGDFESAVVHYERARTLSPDNVAIEEMLEQTRARLSP